MIHELFFKKEKADFIVNYAPLVAKITGDREGKAIVEINIKNDFDLLNMMHAAEEYGEKQIVKALNLNA